MKLSLFSPKSLYLLLTAAFIILNSCETTTTPDGNTDPSVKDAFGLTALYSIEIGESEYNTIYPNATFAINITKETTKIFNMTIGALKDGQKFIGEDDEYFDPYKNTNWKLVEEPNALPPFLSVTIAPDSLKNDNFFTKLTIKTVGYLVNGTYKVRVDANGALFENKRSFYIELRVNVPLPVIHLDFDTDTLAVAPGDTRTNGMDLNGIKEGQNFQISYQTNNIGVMKSWLTVTDSVFSYGKNTAVWSVSVPENATPNLDEEGVNLYLKYLNTNSMIDFEGNQNGFIIEVAGYVIPGILENRTMKFGDTLTLAIDYLVRGRGTFEPKLIPPSSIPPDQIAISQDITSSTNRRNVRVNYKVYFKTMPANKNVQFDVGGVINYGKAVPKKLLIVVN